MRIRKVNRRTSKTVCVVLIALSFAMVAFGHAILVRSNPSANEIISGLDVVLTLTFNSKVDQARSALTLEGPDHSTSRVPITLDASSPANLTAKLPKLSTGPYRLRWQVLAADGHITRGEIPFGVK